MYRSIVLKQMQRIFKSLQQIAATEHLAQEQMHGWCETIEKKVLRICDFINDTFADDKIFQKFQRAANYLNYTKINGNRYFVSDYSYFRICVLAMVGDISIEIVADEKTKRLSVKGIDKSTVISTDNYEALRYLAEDELYYI